MNNQVHTQIVSFIWSIADDCLRDVYVRGKYRDVILPMTVIRRLDAMLEGTIERFFMEVHQNFAQPWTMILQRKRSLVIKT